MITAPEKWSAKLSLVLPVFGLAIVLLAIQSIVHSPTTDEVGHLPAGCLAVSYGRCDLYEVNPPLVKSVAALPVTALHPKYDWSSFRATPGAREEWAVGHDFIAKNGAESFRYFAVARLGLLSIWIVGCVIVVKWSTAVWRESVYAAVVLWCFSPEVMTWTATICPDSAAASLGVMCVWTIRRWLQDLHWTTMCIAGIATGIALCTKSSWLLLVPLYPLLAFSHRHCWQWVTIRQLCCIGLITLYVVNSAYGFAGSFTRLGEFKFFSSTLALRMADGQLRQRIASQAGNRFSGTWLGEIPVPLPASYVEGLDLQKYDFEEGKWSYLRGEHKFGGWWYWYIYALLVKTPVGTLILFAIACGWSVWRVDWRRVLKWPAEEKTHDAASAPSSGLPATFSPEFGGEGTGLELQERKGESGEPKKQRPPVLHENLILLAPAICLFVLVSSQTGFSRYLRYVLPCYPFVFIWMSQIFSAKAGLPPWLRKVCWGLLAWSVISSLSVFPHSMSYFNELAGGPENGPAHLIDASIDWGQDVLFLADWAKEHPEAKPLYLSLHVFFDPRIAGIHYKHAPLDPRYLENRESMTSDQIGPKPGWYSISVHQLYSRNKEFAYLFDFERVDMVGYSIYIYHLTQEQVDDWNRKHGFGSFEK